MTPAQAFLAILWDLIQYFDDVYDINPDLTTDETYKAVTLALVTLPTNEFYRQHTAALAPAIILAIEKWRLANDREAQKKGDARSFMWRAAYWDIAGLVAILEGNDPKPMLENYGEVYEKYLEEVNHA